MMAVAEEIYLVSFAVAGRIAEPKVEIWSTPGGQRVLAIAPHPDDEVIGCAGTLLRHHAAGDQICIAYVTDGSGSHALGLDRKEMARRRRLEAEAGARTLGADRVEWLGLPERNWSPGQLHQDLTGVIGDFKPDIIYAPSLVDYHPDHCQVAYGLALVLADPHIDKKTRVRVYQIQVPLTSILANIVTDIAEVVPASTAAMDVYVTQRDNMGRAIRQRRYSAAFYGMTSQAEEFWELFADRYSELHAVAVPSAAARFRGVRWHSWTDPLAYLRGRAERRELGSRARGEVY
jgi:LmbE family N-acetylglucosaminyl deacetylase